jgi:exopolyphosphatase/guanosine-5'-triphosphate,3'-diphosphate pyrophosphatase
MFAGGDPAQAGRLVWKAAERVLELHLTHDGHHLYGEVAQARLSSLAQAMRAEIRVVQPQ